jgi:predicted helicase
MSWLKSAKGNVSACRILTDVRCLSEGLDAYALDAVIFLSAKNSEI